MFELPDKTNRMNPPMLIVSQEYENDKMQAVTELLESLSKIVTKVAGTRG